MNAEKPLISRFLSIAEADPDAVFLDGKRRLTYGVVAEEVTQRARQLAKAADGAPVILNGFNTVEWVLCFLAARAAGLVIIPMPGGARAEQWRELEELFGQLYLFDATRGIGNLVRARKKRRVLPARADICLLTSGSTGLPRCTLRSEVSLMAEGERYVQSLGLAADDRIIVALPLCHAFTLGLALGGAIAAGCALYLVPQFTPRTVQRLLNEGTQSVLPLVPAAARLLCEVFRDRDPTPSALRHLVIGAGPVTSALEQNIIRRLGRLPARNYGSSETGATIGTTGEVVPPNVTGVALPGVETAVTGDSQPGALFVRTAEPFLGYLLPNGVDASRVSPDGWYSTGDLAICDEHGWVIVTGRIGECLRRGGRFIQPVEVQRALESHADVAEVFVVGSRDEHGEDVVEAHIEARSGMQLHVDVLRRYLEQRIEAYKVPMVWHFYDALPRTGSGKPDYTRLRRSGCDESEARKVALLSTVAAHRLSTALIAGHRLGILAAVETGSGRVEDISFDLGLDRSGVDVLLGLLAAAGVLVRSPDGAYRTVEPLSNPSTSTLIEFENRLQRTWLSVEAVEAAVRSGMPDYPLASTLGADFSDMYTDVMGASTKVLALHAWRQLSLPQGPVLDIGCPAGAWAEVTRQRAPNRHCSTVFDLPPGPKPFDIEMPNERLAAVYVHNAVRRLVKPSSVVSLQRLCDALHENGALIVSDIFADAPSPNPWLRRALMLDWLTHGSLTWTSGAELCSTLENIGFGYIQRIHVDPMFDLIIAQNPDK